MQGGCTFVKVIVPIKNVLSLHWTEYAYCVQCYLNAESV
jgi:hypothetical protein